MTDRAPIEELDKTMLVSLVNNMRDRLVETERNLHETRLMLCAVIEAQGGKVTVPARVLETIEEGTELYWQRNYRDFSITLSTDRKST